MKDKKDMSNRLKYFKNQDKQQHNRKDFYVQQILEIKQLLEMNEKEIRYNNGWINFHKNSIEEHKRQIKKIIHLDKKVDQEQKLQFHREQIENHHKRNIKYHNEEMGALKKEQQLFKEGIKRCEDQIELLQKRMKENTTD